jgi:ADP-ribosylglycohydrolase
MRRSPDHVLGCVVGGAIGDALGGLRERQRLALSDDTQLTLATCEALLETRPPSPERIAATFLQWFLAGDLSGVGSSTLKALRDLAAGSHWALSGATGEMSAGNGAAMRAAPIAFALDPDNRDERMIIRDICRITHRNDEAYIGALAIVRAIRTEEPLTLPGITAIAATLPDSRVRDQLLGITDLDGTAIISAAERFGSSGFVAETVPLALFAASHILARSFEEVIAQLVDIDGDTDTIAAIAGQVAGAHIGFSRIPQNLSSLPPIREIFPKAQAFALGYGVA